MHVGNFFPRTDFFITISLKQSFFLLWKIPWVYELNFITWREWKQLPVGDYVEVIYEVLLEDAREFRQFSTKAWTAIR